MLAMYASMYACDYFYSYGALIRGSQCNRALPENNNNNNNNIAHNMIEKGRKHKEKEDAAHAPEAAGVRCSPRANTFALQSLASETSSEVPNDGLKPVNDAFSSTASAPKKRNASVAKAPSLKRPSLEPAEKNDKADWGESLQEKALTLSNDDDLDYPVVGLLPEGTPYDKKYTTTWRDLGNEIKKEEPRREQGGSVDGTRKEQPGDKEQQQFHENALSNPSGSVKSTIRATEKRQSATDEETVSKRG